MIDEKAEAILWLADEITKESWEEIDKFMRLMRGSTCPDWLKKEARWRSFCNKWAWDTGRLKEESV